MLMAVVINFIQMFKKGIIDEFTCYSIYVPMHLFVDGLPVNWTKFFAGYMMQKWTHLFCEICISLLSFPMRIAYNNGRHN